jgi:hypothetical protein
MLRNIPEERNLIQEWCCYLHEIEHKQYCGLLPLLQKYVLCGISLKAIRQKK